MKRDKTPQTSQKLTDFRDQGIWKDSCKTEAGTVTLIPWMIGDDENKNCTDCSMNPTSHKKEYS
jgi:hypothetical protein